MAQALDSQEQHSESTHWRAENLGADSQHNVKFSYGTPDPTQAVAEYRWYLAKGRKQWASGLILDDELATKLNNFTDDQLKKWITNFKNPEARQCAKFKVPILDGVLSNIEAGFSTDEIEILSKVRWQLTMAEKEIDTMDQFLTMTFTITDEGNHNLAVANRRAAEDGLRKRVGFAISEVRAALSKLDECTGATGGRICVRS